MKQLFPIILTLLLLPALFADAAETELVIDDFETGLRPGWAEKVLAGRTDYRVVRNETGQVLKAESRGAASALIFERKIDLAEYPNLCWRWKVDNIVAKGDARKKEGDDYAARLYVIFPHWFFPKTRTINYIWGNKLPPGAVVPNPFTSNAMMVAVESGKENIGQWRSECRNVSADYRAAFGDDAPPAGAVAIMTDTDNTGGAAAAWYDDIRFRKVQDR
ncbi:MAG: DUF3047 domain-containing protein [Syntrophotaleaceae bacterium]